MLYIWIIVFVVSLFILVKSADWLIASSEKIGLAVGLSPFIVGVTIVALGTSFPEVVASLAGVFQGVSQIVVANAIGSNIANILLVVGISAIVGKKLVVTKSLIDLDLPLLAIGTVLFLGVVWNRTISVAESILMMVVYIIYLMHTFSHRDKEETQELAEILPSRQERRKDILKIKKTQNQERPKIVIYDIILLATGVIGLVFGAQYLIKSVIVISETMKIATSVITITAVAVGTSLPELLVSVKAAMKGKSEVALGNIFGSNVFNLFVVVGLPGIFGTLVVDNQTFFIGLPVLAMATLLFVISGISRRIHSWEGYFYIALYVLFIGRLFNWF